jgi:hypothetical protein
MPPTSRVSFPNTHKAADCCFHFFILPHYTGLTPALPPPTTLSIAAKRPKNISTDELGVTHGQVHMKRQDFDGLHLKKSKALRAELREKAKAARSGKVNNDDVDVDVDVDDNNGDDDGARAGTFSMSSRAVGKKSKRAESF